MKKSTQLILCFTVGLFLILLILVLSFFNRCPTSTQYNILRIILYIGVASIAAIIPGTINFKFQHLITATGAIAVFAFVYIYDPAKLVVTLCPPEKVLLSGTIYVNNKEAKNADVRVNQLKTSAVTDEYGSFNILYPAEDKKDAYNFRVIYGTSLDTSFQWTSKTWQNINFYFFVDSRMIAVNPVQMPNSKGAINAPAQLQKNEIQNYFQGELPESSTANYGGVQYCSYSMKYTNVKLQIKLSQDRKSVQLAKVTFKANEKANPDCPYQSASPNTHVYDLSNASITGQSIFIAFNPDHSNNPLCSLTLTGTIEQNKIIVSMTSQRIDMPDPKLVFSIRMDLQAELDQSN